MNTKSINKSRILRYIIDSGETSKNQIAKALNISMPTVLQNIKLLTDEGLIQEVGAYESTGGRKAKALSVCADIKYALGLDITKNHVSFVLVNMAEQVEKSVRRRKPFCNSMEYYNEISSELEEFIRDSGVDREKILGVGISMPAIIDYEQRLLIKSHVLKLENISLKALEDRIDFPVFFENDANAALMAEKGRDKETALYLSLSNTVGGAISINGKLLRGANSKAGEFGHMIMYHNGKACYCGKKGCVDAYCSALVLGKEQGLNLKEFMKKVKENDSECCKQWDSYLNDLAVVISNLRMIFDMEIILGGYVGLYLRDYMLQLEKKVLAYNLFDRDVTYLKNCTFKEEVSAVGVATYYIEKYVTESKL